MKNKVAIVTGGSSGIGKATAVQLLKQNFIVYEFSRTGSNTNKVNHITADITDNIAVQKAISIVFEQHGKIDLVVNNAGIGISGAVEFTSDEELKRLFDVNFYGMVNVNKQVIPIMRKQGFGRIVNISSVAAVAAIPFQAYYSAAKAAVNSYTLALVNELKPFNISVCAILPGDSSTGFTLARNKSFVGDDVYNGRISRSVFRMEKDEQAGKSAELVGEYVCKVCCKKKVRPFYTVGFAYKVITILLKILPVALSNNIIAKLYAK